MNLIYLEPRLEGHCATFLTIFLDHAQKDQSVKELHVVVGEDLATRTGIFPNNRLLGKVTVEYLDTQSLRACREGPLWRRGLSQWQIARNQLKYRNGAICLIPFFDQTLLGAVLDRRHVKGVITGIIFRPPTKLDNTAQVGKIVKTLWKMCAYIISYRRATPVLFTLDEEYKNTTANVVARRFKFVPDPFPLAGEFKWISRESRSNSTSRTKFLLFGALNERKGIFVLLKSLRCLSDEEGRRSEFQFVGRLSDMDARAFQSELWDLRVVRPNLKLSLIDEYVEDKKLIRIIENSDVVLLPYQNHVGSSGGLYWAAAAHKPVIGQNSGLIGIHLLKFGLGLSCNTADPVSLTEAIRKFIWSDRTKFVSGARFDDFLRGHTPTNFYQALTTTFQRLM